MGAVSGNLGISGGGVSFYFKRRGAFDTSFIRGKVVAPRTICEPLFGSEVMKSNDPPIRALWITAGNPVAMLPDSNTIAEALRSREFVVVVDSFFTDTARLAHLILPTTTLLEADDLLGAYGHHWIGVAKPVVAPPEEVRSDLEIVQGLAERLGLGDLMAGSATDWKRRLVEPVLGRHGATFDALEAGPIRSPIAPKVLFANRKFSTISGRVNLVRDQPPVDAPDINYPLWLMSLSTAKAQSSQWAISEDGPAQVTVHPEACQGLADGSICRLESAIGSMLVTIHHDARQRRDVAIVPKGGHYSQGRCANVLLKARTTDLGEGGALYDERVRLVPS